MFAWPLRSVLAGTAGTATMTLAYAAEGGFAIVPRARSTTTTASCPARSSPRSCICRTSFGTHAAYVAAVAAVDDAVARAILTRGGASR